MNMRTKGEEKAAAGPLKLRQGDLFKKLESQSIDRGFCSIGKESVWIIYTHTMSSNKSFFFFLLKKYYFFSTKQFLV